MSARQEAYLKFLEAKLSPLQAEESLIDPEMAFLYEEEIPEDSTPESDAEAMAQSEKDFVFKMLNRGYRG